MKQFAGFAIKTILGVVFTLSVFFYGFNAHATPPKPTHEWTLPATFEHQGGAFAIGCAFWELPILHPYTSENPNIGYAQLGFGKDPTGVIGVLAIVDGPRGMATLMGSNCAIGVDWSAFPERERPSPKLPTQRADSSN